jgi:pimeloyl-ACP methyl ester carboxylesterase
MRRVWQGVGALSALGALALAIAASPRGELVDPPAPPVPADPDAWIAERIAASQADGVKPQALERLVRQVDGASEVAFLFVHGFGAGPGEGAYVVDQLAVDWGANAYYTRLPGHGLDKHRHASTTPDAWLADVADALAVTAALGKRVVVVGASTGSALATWLAATYPDRVDALVLTSPFYDYPDPWMGSVLNSRAGVHLAQAVLGDRDCRMVSERRQPQYGDHWLEWQRHQALAPLEQVRRHCSRPELHAQVTQPTLMMYHYAGPEPGQYDGVVSIEAMRDAYGRFNAGRPHAKSRLVAVADGNHVLLSEHVRTDKRAVRMALDVFLSNVLQ